MNHNELVWQNMPTGGTDVIGVTNYFLSAFKAYSKMELMHA